MNSLSCNYSPAIYGGPLCARPCDERVHLIPSTPWVGNCCHYAHFTGKEAEVQGESRALLRSHSQILYQILVTPIALLLTPCCLAT